MTMFAVLMTASFTLVFAYGVYVSAQLVRRSRIRLKQRNFERNRVTLEEVQTFASRKCKICKGTGRIMRYADPRAPVPMPTPCGCAAREFMRNYEADTEMLGQFRLWKRGRRPSNVNRSEARAKARAATA